MSTLKVNTLQDASGGNSSTSEQINEGRAKNWINFNGNTPAIRDSFNVSSLTDNATGDFTVNFSTSFSNANYCVNSAGNYQDSAATGRLWAPVRQQLAGSVRVKFIGAAAQDLDSERSFVCCHGDM